MSEKKNKIQHLESFVSIITNVCVVASVIFLGLEIQQNNSYLRRSEVNATMEQSNILRMAAWDRDFAELLVQSQANPEGLDAADRLRMRSYYSQIFWGSWQIYDRERGGYVDEGEWQRAGRGMVLQVLSTEAGRTWWNDGRSVGMPPDFIALVNDTFAEAMAAAPR